MVPHKTHVGVTQKAIPLNHLGVEIGSDFVGICHMAVVEFFVVGLELLNPDIRTHGSTPFRSECIPEKLWGDIDHLVDDVVHFGLHLLVFRLKLSSGGAELHCESKNTVLCVSA